MNMVTVRPDEQLIAQLFDTQPDSVVWYSPVISDESGEIVDFETAYCNVAAGEVAGYPAVQILGTTLFNSPILDSKTMKMVFDQCLQVWNNGALIEFNYYNPVLDRHFNVQRSKVLGGILTIARDNSIGRRAELERVAQEKKYKAILDSTGDGLLLLEAVRNNSGAIIDFRIAECNRAAFQLGMLPDNAIDKTIFEVLPALRNSSQMHLYREVVESGEPVRYETQFMTPEGIEYGWFLISLTRFGDGVISRFVDISDKKINQQKIEEQAELLRSILNASPIGIVACKLTSSKQNNTPELQIIKFNQYFSRLFGMSRESIAAGLTLSQSTYFAKSELLGNFIEVADTGINQQFQYSFDIDGKKKWFDVCAVPLTHKGIVITFTDITEQKNALAKIQEEADKLQKILNASINGVFAMEAIRNGDGQVLDFRIIQVNDSFEKILGVKPEIAVGSKYTELFTATVPSGIFDLHVQALEHGKPVQQEIYYNSEGIEGWFNISISKMGDNTLVQTFTDVTESKKDKLLIEESAQKLQVVLDSSQTGIYLLQPVCDSDGSIADFIFKSVNRTVASYTGKPASELVGISLLETFPAFKNSGIFEMYVEAFVTRQQKRTQIHYHEATLDVWLDILASRITDGLLVTFHDFTPLKTLQQQQEELLDDLKLSNERLSEFAHVASHDLQEPLRKIHFFADHLKNDLENIITAEQQRKFGRLQDAADRMRRLIDDLLAYSAVSRERSAIEQVQLPDLVQQVLNDFESHIIEKRAIVSVSDLPSLPGNPQQLRQLFQNLISNSLKYSRAEVTPMINIRSRMVKETIKGMKKNYCYIEVEDNGIGFDPSESERIFQLFQRLHNRSEYPGTGIGLAIVQKVVENHNGYIEASGAPGAGSTFKIYLPLK